MVAIRTARWPGSAPKMRAPAAVVRSPAGQLLEEVEAFLRAHPQFTPTSFSIQALGHGDLAHRLRHGCNPRPATAQRVRTFIAEYET